MKDVLPNEIKYPILSIVYRAYVLDEVDNMSEDVDAYLAEFASPEHKEELDEFAKMMSIINQNTQPTEDMVNRFAEMIRDELMNEPRRW